MILHPRDARHNAPPARVDRIALIACIVCVLAQTNTAAQQAGRQTGADARARRVTFTIKDRPSLRFGDAGRLDFRLGLQADARDFDARLVADEPALDWSRKRIGVEGQFGGLVSFQIEREFASGDPWRDVYANYEQFDVLQVQAGKFKLPFCLDENTSYRNLDFVYRAQPSIALAPGRDRGVMVHGRIIGRRLEYFAGVFDHDGANARRRDPRYVSGGRTVAARIVARPFRASRSAARTLEFGGAVTDSTVPEGYWSLRGETALGRKFYETDFWVLGPQRRQGAEFRWRPGPFSVKAEYMRLTTARRGQSVHGTDLPPLVAEGWYVSGTWAVTGERKADGLDNPRKPIGQGGPGAIEAAARVETLGFSSSAPGNQPSTSPRAPGIAGNQLRAITAGVNWYPVRWVKVQFNVIRETLDGPGQGPLLALSPLWSRVLRLQFAW